MTHPLHRLAPQRNRRPRDPNDAIAGLTPTGYGSGAASRKIADLLLDQSPLMVACTDLGEVFAVDPLGTHAAAIEAKHPEWIVGTYTLAIEPAQITADLQDRAKELRGRAA